MVERRTAHELEVLRQLSEVVEAFGIGQALRARDLLMLLPGSSDLPLLRAAVDTRPSEKAKAAFATKYPSAATLPEPTNLNRDCAKERCARFRLVHEDRTSRAELDKAIERRLSR